MCKLCVFLFPLYFMQLQIAYTMRWLWVNSLENTQNENVLPVDLATLAARLS